MTALASDAAPSGLPPSRALFALLSALAAIGSVSTNIILPSFPAIATELGVPVPRLGLTLSVFFAVFAIGQLFVGPLSDRYGRRGLVLGGLLAFCAGSALCALATDFATLVTGRAIQGLGACAASVLARAIARDLFEGETLARVMAMVVVAMAAAPGFSPLIGSLAQASFGWRTTFVAVGVLGLGLAVWYAVRLQETHPASRRTPLAIGTVFATYGALLADLRFLRPAIVVSCVTGGLFGFFTAAPNVLIAGIGLSGTGLAWLFAGTVPVVFASGLLVPRFSRRWGGQRVLQAGMALALAGGLLVGMVSVLDPRGLAPFTAALCVFLFGMGMANPLGTALALGPFGARAGAASAMLGFMQMSGAALGAAFVTGLTGAAPMTTLALVLVGSQIVAIGAFVLLRPGRPAADPA